MSGDDTMADRIAVLFVDDERNILDGLRRQFRSRHKEWDMRFAGSAKEAIGLLEQQPADVIVSDMRMPERNGSALLREVQSRWPTTARFILSGQTDHSEMVEDIGCIHQFLQKPCDPELLIRSITRCRELSSVLRSPQLKGVTSRIQSLPVVSETYLALSEALENEDVDVDMLTEIVERDVGLTTKLLQMVNSAFFGMPRTFTKARDAVNLVGSKQLRMLALTAQIVDSLSDSVPSRATISTIWRESADVGAMAAALARANRQTPEVIDAARLAGTLSLIGRGILACYLTDEFDAACAYAAAKRIGLHEAELATMHVTQESIGAYALGLWGFADEIIEAVARQSDPEESGIGTAAHPLPYVHLARSVTGDSSLAEPVKLSTEWIESLGVDPQIAERKEAA